MYKIKKLQFPSLKMPGADLRLSLEYNDTKYEFRCEKCNEQVTIVLEDFIKYEYNWRNAFSKDIVNEISEKFNYGGKYCSTKCKSCNSEYILQIEYNETSNNAYRAEILDAGLLE